MITMEAIGRTHRYASPATQKVGFNPVGQVVGQMNEVLSTRELIYKLVEEYVEGYAERIEYDEKADTVKMVTRARVRLLENDVQRDELRGDSITYDQRNSKYFVTGGKPSADPNNPDGRVRGTIAPRSNNTPKSGTASPLKSATDIANPRPN
jgi:lipopolysaccharide export system protein LptA